MFINILHKTFVTYENNSLSYITDEFFTTHDKEDWQNNRYEYINFNEYLYALANKQTRRYYVYPMIDADLFIANYAKSLNIDYDDYKQIVDYNRFSITYAEDLYGLTNTLPTSLPEDIYNSIQAKKIKRHYEYFPAEYAINCLDKEWARNKFHFFRICDITTQIKKIQRAEYEATGNIPNELIHLTANNLTCHKLLDNDYYNEVYTLFKRNHYDTKYFDMSLEEYINDPECLFGYNELNYYKFNARLARSLQRKGYRIDD